MALGGVFMRDTDGNIGVENINLSEQVCGLLFDISAQNTFWTGTAGQKAAPVFKDTIVELTTLDDAVQGGIAEYSDLTATTAVDYLLNGVAYYHIKQYFDRVGGSGRLYVMFADCSTNFNAIIEMQNAAKGMISQFGVWTERNIWKVGAEDGDLYQNENLIADLDTIAASLANDYNAPCSILLCGNTAKVKKASGTQDTVDIAKIPTVITDHRYVSVLLSQDRTFNVAAIQASLASKTPVGALGCALGSLASMLVSDSIGWVQGNDIARFISDIELGFGDVTLTEGQLANTTPYSALTASQIDALDDKGYIFLCRYTGLEASIFFSGDKTCSEGDYRTISRNRVINKSRRLVRTALLPYVNSKIKVDPTTGQLSAAQISIFSNLVRDALTTMENAEEISGIGSVVIPANQNILRNDKLLIKYTLVPMGIAKTIEVTEGLVLNSQA